jgi:hypothetical protein
MNERIKELCSKAISDVDGIQNPDTQHMYIPDCFRDRFAELIVKETMQVVANQLPSNQYLDVAHAVIEHFGVGK